MDAILRFIEALRLKSRLFLLFFLVMLGLVMLGLVGALNTQDMKHRIDSLYFGAFVPVMQLENILYSYDAKILPMLYRAKSGRLAKEQLQKDLLASLKEIERLWGAYSALYKSKEELEYVAYAGGEIQKSNDYLYKLLAASKAGYDLTKLAIAQVERKIAHIDEVIKRLLDYEIALAHQERKEFLGEYDKIVRNMGMMLGGIIFAVLFITYRVFRSIQIEHTKLEAATKKLHHLNKKLESASYTDSLTSLHNRRYFNITFDREIRRAKRERRYITFMMIDIDFFKQYNDTYGHIAGDRTLKAVAQAIKRCFRRPSDFTFRLGGEEFGALLVDTDELGSARLAKQLCKQVRALGIEHKSSKASDVVTVSVGVVSCVADDALDGDMLIKKADEMLYRAKEEGRNRYIITNELY